MRFVKVNFDGSVRDDRGGVDYVILSSDAKLLIADGSHLFELSIPGVEIRAAWADIICARQELRTESIFIKDDSNTVIS